MKTTLVGHTGFVGGNLAQRHKFDHLYNSRNIQDAFGADNGLVVYSGMPSEKFLANKNPGQDRAAAARALENMLAMRPSELVLISTVDVYSRPQGVDEGTLPGRGGQGEPYGQNRLWLEEKVREAFPEALILRLPGLFGKGLKKNFIYDMLTLTPSVLTKEIYGALAEGHPLVRDSYRIDENGFYRLDASGSDKKSQLRAFFEQNDFNAMRFTDSRSVFQFYDLTSLWDDIGRCRKAGLRLVNMATQPVEAGALYSMLYGGEFENYTQKGPVRYDMYTLYGRELGGLDHYIADSADVVAGIAKFAAGFTVDAMGEES